MVQIVGLIVAVYAVARLLQVPIEASPSDKRAILLWIISLPAILALAGLTLMLLVSGTTGLSNLK